jgi:4-amino-4-deoxy-L-arabinose transferase-like glycosyltransferase
MSASNTAPPPVTPRTIGRAAPRRAIGGFAAIAIALVIALAILSLGITAPFERDAESQSAQWVVDIAQNGNWLLPLDYYDLVERKPPLFYWLGAIGVKLYGGEVDEARVRMPSLFAGAAVSALVMDWAAADLGDAGGWLAFFFLLGMYGFAARATVALTDMLMTFLLIVEWRIIRTQLDGAISWPRTLFAGLLLGLGILVKGPVIAVLVALATVLYFAMSHKNPARLATRAWPWAWFAIACAVAMIWYVPALITGRSNAWGRVFVDENLGHFLPPWMGGTGEAARPLYYIAVRLLGGTMPLSFLVPALALAFVHRPFVPPLRRAMFYQLAMVLAVVVLFSASSAKRDDYILPAIPPLAILFAALFTHAITTATTADGSAQARSVAAVRDLTTLAIAVIMLLGVVATVCFARAGGNLDTFGARLQSSDTSFAAVFLEGMSHLHPRFAAFATAVVIGATVAISGFARRAAVRSGTGLAILCVAGSTLWTGVLKPQVAITRSIGPFARAVKALVGAEALYVGFIDPEFAWYYGSGVPPLPHSLANAASDPGKTIYFVARPNELLRLAPPVRQNLILVLPSSVLGANPPSLYMLGSPEDGLAHLAPSRSPSPARNPHSSHSGTPPPSSPSPGLNNLAPWAK